MSKRKKYLRPLSDALSIVGYLRVSTPGQAELGVSLDAQKNAIERYAAQRGYQVLRFYREEGASGTDDNRPVFQQMMDEVLASDGAQKVDAIVVFQTSRFMRSALKAKIWKDTLEKAGIRVLSVQQDFGEGDSAHLMEGIFETFDEYESLVIGSRTRAGMAQVARQGFFPGARAPYGYMRQKVDVSPKVKRSMLVPNPEEIPTLRELFRLYIGGTGAKSTAVALSRHGYPMRNGKPWTKDAVLNVIAEEAAAGTYYWGKKRGRKRGYAPKEMWVPVFVEPILSRETWELAQRVRAERDPEKVAGRTGSSPLLLAGIVKCGRCDAPVILETSGKRKPDGSYGYRYYNCRTFLKKGRDACVGSRIPEDVLDRAVLQHLAEHLFTEERCRLILKDLVEEAGLLRERTAQHRAAIKDELAEIERRQRRWEDLIESGQLVPEAGGRRMLELAQRRKELEETLAKIVPFKSPPPHLYTSASIGRFQKMLREALRDGSGLSRAYLRHLVEEIVVEGLDVRVVAKSAGAYDLMVAANGKTPPPALTRGGEVLVSVVEQLREQDLNL